VAVADTLLLNDASMFLLHDLVLRGAVGIPARRTQASLRRTRGLNRERGSARGRREVAR